LILLIEILVIARRATDLQCAGAFAIDTSTHLQ
jgi:hypothetical protein